MSFGNNLKKLREELNLTREELSEELGLSYSALSKYETDLRFPDKETLSRIADYFDVSVDYMLGRTNKRKYDIDTLAFSTKLDIEGLSDEDLEAVQNIIDALKNKYK